MRIIFKETKTTFSVKSSISYVKELHFLYLLFPHNLKPQHIRCMFIFICFLKQELLNLQKKK